MARAKAIPAAAVVAALTSSEAGVPDGTIRNKMAFAIEKLEAAALLYCGDGGNGDKHAMLRAVGKVRQTFEGLPDLTEA